MRKILAYGIISFLVFFLAIGSFLYFRLGLNSEVVIEQIDGPEFLMLYKVHRGPYHEIIGSIEHVEDWAKKNKTSCLITFGEYLDNPDSVDPDRLTSNGGCLLIEALSEKGISELPQEIGFKKIEPKKYVKATFKGSPAVGPFTVYPKVTKYMSENRLQITGPVIETYTETNGGEGLTTEYYFPL